MLDRRTAWIVALVATATMTVSYVDRTTLAVLAPTITKELDISEAQYGWLTSAFSFAYLVATPFAGWWIDRAGARRGLVTSVLAWSAVAALHALVPGFGVLLALRIALGMAEGPSFPGAAQTVSRVLPPADRSRGFGVLFTGSSIGAMLTPPLASWLYDLAGWRVAFLGTAVVGLAWLPIWLAFTSRADVRAKMDATEVVAEAPVARAIPLHHLVLEPVIQRALIAIFAVAPVIGLVGAWGAKYLVRIHAIDQAAVGHFLWLPPLGLDLGAVLFGDLAGRQLRAAGVPPRALFAGAALMTASMALLPLATTPWQAMAIMAVALAGGGAVYTLVTGDALGRVPRHVVSSAGGVIAGAQSLALVVANPLVGMAVAAYGTYDVVAIALGCWVVPGCAVWWAWRPPAGLVRAARTA